MTELAALLAGRRLLIFDFDGTLADTSLIHAEAFSTVLAPLGVPVDYPTVAGLATGEAMERLLAGAGVRVNARELAALVADKQRLGRALIAERIVPLPGVAEFLAWAQPRYRLALVTSGSRTTIAGALGRLGFAGLFDPAICADDCTRAKPDPEGFRLALQRAGVPAHEALVFEDSAAGFAAAAAAGIDCFDANANLWHALGSAAAA